MAINNLRPVQPSRPVARPQAAPAARPATPAAVAPKAPVKAQGAGFAAPLFRVAGVGVGGAVGGTVGTVAGVAIGAALYGSAEAGLAISMVAGPLAVVGLLVGAYFGYKAAKALE